MDDAGTFFIVLPVGVGVGRVSETRHLYLRIEDQRRKHIHSYIRGVGGHGYSIL